MFVTKLTIITLIVKGSITNVYFEAKIGNRSARVF